jgi:hypothetical protein
MKEEGEGKVRLELTASNNGDDVNEEVGENQTQSVKRGYVILLIQ